MSAFTVSIGGKRTSFAPSEPYHFNQFITGDKYTVADAYLFTVLNWTNIHKIDLAKWPNARIGARPKVQETMRAEGLLG